MEAPVKCRIQPPTPLPSPPFLVGGTLSWNLLVPRWTPALCHRLFSFASLSVLSGLAGLLVRWWYASGGFYMVVLGVLLGLTRCVTATRACFGGCRRWCNLEYGNRLSRNRRANVCPTNYAQCLTSNVLLPAHAEILISATRVKIDETCGRGRGSLVVRSV